MSKFIKILLIILSALLVLMIFISLPWRFQHDSPIMFYISFLMDHFGYVPYRDIFDMNMPGADFAYYFIVKIFGYSDLGIRTADLLILSILLGVNWLWMRKISSRAAWMGSVLFGLAYLNLGAAKSMQREYLVLLPILAGVYLYSSEPKAPFLRNIAIGFFFGAAATIKPHAAVGLPLIVLLEFLQMRKNLNISGSKQVWMFTKHTLFPVAIGFCLPLAAVFIYFWATRSFAEFLDMAKNYWPLYAALGGDHKIRYGLVRAGYLFENFFALGGLTVWLAPAALGSFLALFHSPLDEKQKQQVILLVGLTICYGIYPVFAGQFWKHHWIPFMFFVIQTSALCLIYPPVKENLGRRLFPIILLLFAAMQVIPFAAYKDFFTGQKLAPPEDGRVDQIVQYLAPRLRPEDTIQPLDWVGGAVHAMLILKAPIATPFIYNFYFYHHISNDYIQGLRSKFIEELMESPPRFIIDVETGNTASVQGDDTTTDFKELEDLLDKEYRVVNKGNGYIIYELH